jgi:hypothetical protein
MTRRTRRRTRRMRGGSAWEWGIKMFGSPGQQFSKQMGGFKKGGNAISQAVVPGALFMMNNVLGRKRHKRVTHRRRRP